jgi:hypothetical protein
LKILFFLEDDELLQDLYGDDAKEVQNIQQKQLEIKAKKETKEETKLKSM